jgi:hypothetical protein
MSNKPRFHCDARASFAVAFGNWRRKNKIQLKNIARDLGVSISTVSSWEMGKRFPGGRHFEMLVDYTGLPPCRLFCVMADKCVPADCLLAMSRIAPKPVSKPAGTSGLPFPVHWRRNRPALSADCTLSGKTPLALPRSLSHS